MEGGDGTRGTRRPARGDLQLLDRDRPLQVIERMLDEAEQGFGRAFLIEGHAGMGKTRLHDAAVDRARERGMRVLRAAGAELERAIAFGVAAQLLRALLAELPPGRRRRLLASAPETVRTLAGLGSHPTDFAGDLAVSHGLFALLATADERRPALIAIDDLHWCDGASLEFLLYVLHRLDEFPVAVLLSRRRGHSEDLSDHLDLVATHLRVEVEDLAPLGQSAVGELAEEVLGDRASDEVVAACCEATAGNPFYLRELLLALSEEQGRDSGELAQRARALAPDAVTRIVRVRVGRLGFEAAALARSVVILGDDAPLRQAAQLAGLSVERAASAADALASVDVLAPREPLRFVHQLVRHAIAADIPASERASRHLEAARLLDAEGAAAERVAAHLLLGRPQGDEWVIDRLCAAAREASARSATRSAATYLLRALDEPPLPDRRGAVLGKLGVTEALAGMPKAAEHLAQAAVATDDPRRRARLTLELGRAFEGQGLHERAALAFEQGLRELPRDPTEDEDRELHDQLQAGFLATATLLPSLQPRVVARSAALAEQAPAVPRTQGQRLVLAQAAQHASFRGEPANQVLGLAERAWDEGRILTEAGLSWVGWRVVTTAFLLGGELERSVEVCEAAIADARQRGWPLGFATASFMRAFPQLWRGQVDAALADLEAARDAQRYGWHQFVRAAAAHYALCLVEKDQLERADAVLAEVERPDVRDLEEALCLYSLSAIRFAQGRAREALETVLGAGELVERHVNYFGYLPWRTAAAQAALALGERERALELAREAAARAERIDVLHQRIRTLRVLGLCQSGAQRIETLRRAVELGKAGPPRLETIRALIELGAALRRENHRLAAREPLQLAADVALRGGASALHARARTELAATGARPRRDALLSGPASLTPSERRIAELAAAGQANREIAQGLFVTPKTVEYHLRNVYRKLGVERRRELADVLSS